MYCMYISYCMYVFRDKRNYISFMQFIFQSSSIPLPQNFTLYFEV